MSDKKKPYDMKAPEAKGLIDDIVHGTFMREGTMVAFPTCFPGASVPIPADESHITALDVNADGIVYGGTSGRAVHLFVGMFHGVTGLIFDRGVVEGATRTAAVCCGKSSFIACVNGPDGGRIISSAFQDLPFDLIQEWGFHRRPLNEIGKTPGETILHAVADATRSTVVGITPSRLFAVDIEAGKFEIIGEITGRGRIGLGANGRIYGQDGAEHLWRYDIASRRIDRRAVALPEGDWDLSMIWARDAHDGLLYTADRQGTLFSLSDDKGFGKPLGKTPLAPVGPTSVTHDGRVFGFCGDELARMFCCNPRTGQITDAGVAVSILERRRYGYVFGDAVTGRDGQVYFGEDDDLGHLWLYFPKILGRES